MKYLRPLQISHPCLGNFPETSVHPTKRIRNLPPFFRQTFPRQSRNDDLFLEEIFEERAKPLIFPEAPVTQKPQRVSPLQHTRLKPISFDKRKTHGNQKDLTERWAESLRNSEKLSRRKVLKNEKHLAERSTGSLRKQRNLETLHLDELSDGEASKAITTLIYRRAILSIAEKRRKRLSQALQRKMFLKDVQEAARYSTHKVPCRPTLFDLPKKEVSISGTRLSDEEFREKRLALIERIENFVFDRSGRCVFRPDKYVEGMENIKGFHGTRRVTLREPSCRVQSSFQKTQWVT